MVSCGGHYNVFALTMVTRGFVLLIVACIFLNVPLQGQADKPGALDADKLIREWFHRLNALDEEPGTVAKMVELYASDAMQFIGPGEDQLGTVMFRGHEGLRKW